MRRGTLLRNLVLIAVMLAGTLAIPRLGVSPASAGEDRETAVAEGTFTVADDVEAGDYVWQGTPLLADPQPGAEAPFHFGFLVAIDQPMEVTNADGGVTPVLPGEAFGVREGEVVSPRSTGETAALFTAVELVPVDLSDDPAAIAFPLQAGRYELTIQRFTPPAGDATEIRGLTQPILILAQAGGFSVAMLDGSGAATGEATPLAPGDAATLLFDSRLEQTGTDPSAFLIATLDPVAGASPSASASPSPSLSPAPVASTAPRTSAVPLPSGGVTGTFGQPPSPVPSTAPSPSLRAAPSGFALPSVRPPQSVRPSGSSGGFHRPATASPSSSVPPFGTPRD